MDIQFFRTPFATVTKAYRGDNGEMFVEGIASSTNLDQTKEKMSPEAIKLMAAKFTGKPLNSEHHNDWDDKLGEIVKSDVIDQSGKPALWIKAKLNDWLTRSKDLFNGLNTGKLTDIGFSVEGKINPGGLVKEFDPALGYAVPVYRDIDPGAVAITNKPANLDTFVNAVSKSIKMEELPDANAQSYVIIRKVVDGNTISETMKKDNGVGLGVEPNPLVDDQTEGVDDPLCPHGMSLQKDSPNMCKICTASKAVDTAYAGPVPASGLARQDLATVGEGKKKPKDTTKAIEEALDAVNKANEAVKTARQLVKDGAPIPAISDDDLKNPPADNSTDSYESDFLEPRSGTEGATAGETVKAMTLEQFNEFIDQFDFEKADSKVTNAHDKKPSKYSDVPNEKFLDPQNKKYPADAKHLHAALSYFNHGGQRSAGGYTPAKWATMGRKLAGLLGAGYHYDASSEKVVQSDSKGDAKKSNMEGGESNSMLQHNEGVLQKTPYSQEVLDIIKAWGGNNPGNYDIFAKADASAVSPGMTTPQGQVQPQQTVQKGSSSSSDGSTSTGSSSSDGSSSSGSGSSSSDGSSSSSDGSTSTSSGDSLSSLLSSVLTTLSDLKSSVSGDSSSSSSDDSSSGSSSTGSSKTSTDKNFPFQSGSASSVDDKTSTDKNFGSSSVSSKTSTDKAVSDVSSTDPDSSTDEATKALTLAIANLQAAIEKTKKQPPTGQYAENGTQKPSALPKEGNDSVNGKPQEPDYGQEAKGKHPMPKANTGSSDNVNGSAQEPDYNSLAGSDPTSTGSSLGKSRVGDQAQFIKSLDTLSALMMKLGEKVEAVEGKVESLPGVRKGIAINKEFTQTEQQDLAKAENDRRAMEAKLIADPKVDFKLLHQFRTYGTLPAWYQQ